jgi:hypothetical protein
LPFHKEIDPKTLTDGEGGDATRGNKMVEQIELSNGPTAETGADLRGTKDLEGAQLQAGMTDLQAEGGKRQTTSATLAEVAARVRR